jgi:mRNA interferase HicA
MNAQELRRLLASKGCTFETHKGGSGHLKGLVNKILKDLGLK